MIELAESSSISTTTHEVMPRRACLPVVRATGRWGWRALAHGRILSGPVILSTGAGWVETFELGSLWELGPVKTLIALRALPHNWDGADSPPPTDVALSSSFELVRLIGEMGHDAIPVPHVVPLAHGGVQLEWRSGNRELEIAVFADGTIEFVTAENGDPQLEGPLSTFDQMRPLFTWLTAAA